jgi:hypothetical protein
MSCAKKTELIFCSAIVELVEETKARYKTIIFKTLDLVWLTLLLLITTSFLPTHRNYYVGFDGNAMGWQMGGGGAVIQHQGKKQHKGSIRNLTAATMVIALFLHYCVLIVFLWVILSYDIWGSHMILILENCEFSHLIICRSFLNWYRDYDTDLQEIKVVGYFVLKIISF